jgi:hypothetical protein
LLSADTTDQKDAAALRKLDTYNGLTDEHVMLLNQGFTTGQSFIDAGKND